MSIKNIVTLAIIQFVISFSGSFALDCNYKLLEMRAEGFNSQVWNHSELHTTTKEIETNLDFIYPKEASKVTSKDFEALCARGVERMNRVKTHEIGNQAALNFNVLLHGFREIYAAGEETKQVAVSLLLESILEKSSPTLKRLERLVKSSEHKSAQHPKIAGVFSNSDRSQPLLPSREFVVF